MATTTAGVGMNIERAVKYAIAEFGKFAHERFRCKVDNGDWHTPLRNDMLLMWLTDNKIAIELKSLPELFNHDVEFYGADAYFMWDIDTQWILNFNFSFDDNFTVECALSDDRSLLKRKTSAALPFDLARARDGDTVEFEENGTCHTCKKCEIPEFYDLYFNKNLRMKYPKKSAI